MPTLSKPELHQRVVDALLPRVVEERDLGNVPFLLDVAGIVPLAIWAFNLTSPPGGRPLTESKIQLMTPGQGRSEPGYFIDPPGRFRILIGISPAADMFVLWDGYKHEGFAFSKNAQVKGEVIWDASILGIARAERRLASGTETVIACRRDHLFEAIHERVTSDDG